MCPQALVTDVNITVCGGRREAETVVLPKEEVRSFTVLVGRLFAVRSHTEELTVSADSDGVATSIMDWLIRGLPLPLQRREARVLQTNLPTLQKLLSPPGSKPRSVSPR